LKMFSVIDLTGSEKATPKKPTGAKVKKHVIQGRSKWIKNTAVKLPNFGCKCKSYFINKKAFETHVEYWKQRGKSNFHSEFKREISRVNLRQSNYTPIPNPFASLNPPPSRPSTSILAISFSEMNRSERVPQSFIFLPPLPQMMTLPLDINPTIATLLMYGMKCVVFLDLDNIPMCSVSEPCPEVVLWGFYGASLTMANWPADIHLAAMCHERRLLMTRCGPGKNSADFGLSFHASQLHLLLPSEVGFIVYSCDADHHNTARHLLASNRNVVCVQSIGSRKSLPDILAAAKCQNKFDIDDNNAKTRVENPDNVSIVAKDNFNNINNKQNIVLNDTLDLFSMDVGL